MKVEKRSDGKLEAAGERVSVSGGAAEIPKSVTLETIRGYMQNIHLANHYQNLNVQVFPGAPQVWVEDVNGEMDSDRTEEIKQIAKRIGLYTSMQISYYDTTFYGCSVKSVGYARDKGTGLYVPVEIRNLPPQSFNQTAPTNGITVNQLMPGIIVTKEGEVEVWQSTDEGAQVRIDNHYIIKEPTTAEPSGAAYALPCYPIIASIDFTNKAINQQINRVGAPLIFPQVMYDARESEEELKKWADGFLRRWGKDTGFLLPAGVTFPEVRIKEGSIAQDRLDVLIGWLDAFFNPTTILQKTSGTSIGASDSGAAEIWANFIGGTQVWIEAAYEELLQPYLSVNGYDDLYVRIRLKRPEINRSEERRNQVLAAVQAKAITVEEVRDNLSELQLKEWSEDIKKELDTEYASAGGFGAFGNVGEVKGEDKIITQTEKTLVKIDEEILASLARKL